MESCGGMVLMTMVISLSLFVLGNRSDRVEMKFSGARLSGSPKGYLVSLSSLG